MASGTTAPGPVVARPQLRAGGVVTAFDGPRGLGTVRDDGGTERPFHCTAIADGSRAIEVGRRVTFTVVPGHLGRWEATHIAYAGATTDADDHAPGTSAPGTRPRTGR